MSKYEDNRLIAISSFVEKLITDKYYSDTISDTIAELSGEISMNNGHVINFFDKLQSNFDNDSHFYFLMSQQINL